MYFKTDVLILIYYFNKYMNTLIFKKKLEMNTPKYKLLCNLEKKKKKHCSMHLQFKLVQHLSMRRQLEVLQGNRVL